MGATPTSELQISAIVPTLNEAEGISATLESLRRGGVAEIVVVDAGSEDDTLARAKPFADRVLVEGGGLFRQLNRGAAEASGDVFLFQYADVLFPETGGDGLKAALLDEGVVGGSFKFGLTSKRLRYRVTAGGANFRNHFGLGPFGDQSLFMRREAFRAVGGYAPEAFFADLALVKSLRRRGEFRILPDAVEGSVRRWESLGFRRTFCRHFWMYVLYVTRLGRPTRGTTDRSQALRGVR